MNTAHCTHYTAGHHHTAGVAATGISISVDKVVAALARQDSWGPSLCQVVVGGDREEAARLATQLWAGGVAARLEEAPGGTACWSWQERSLGAGGAH